MKVLIANFITKGNRYLIDFQKGLESYADVVWDYEEFWKCENDYDIVHIHWPEFLSYEVQNYLWTTDPFPKQLFNQIENCLKYWKQHATIIYTRHNQHPHLRHDKDYLNLYRMVTSYCHTVVHFANYSIEQFKLWYPEHQGITHLVIPHHNYAAMKNVSSQHEARQHLNIDLDATVMLVFGTVFDQEKAFIKKALSYIPSKKKVLLAPSWKVNRRKIGYIRLREWVWNFEKWWAQQNKNFQIDKGFIKEDDAHWYINAADFMLIPRQKELNSGNITLGFTFAKVVLGRQGGDIGELLNEHSNPTFKEGNDESLKEAIEAAIQLSKTNKGQKNQELVMSQCDVATISEHYITAMLKAMERKNQKLS